MTSLGVDPVFRAVADLLDGPAADPSTSEPTAVTRRRLSVVVVTLNEEERLRACLESVAWADEVVVVDALSQDKTAQIAREFTDRVIVRPWPGFAAQKNFGLAEAGGDWILSLDADEQVSPELREEILGVLAADGPSDGYRVPRRNLFGGQWIRHGGLWPDWQLRLFRRGRGTFVERAVHESVEVAASVGRCRARWCIGATATSRTFSRAPIATRLWRRRSG